MSEFQPRSPHPRRSRRFAVLAAAALALLGGFAPAAQATKTTLQFTCDYPFLGEAPLSLAIEATAPTPVLVNTQVASFPVSAVATDTGHFADWMDVLAATQISGTTKLTTRVTAPTMNLPIIQSQLITPNTAHVDGARPFSWPLAGTFPPLRYSGAGLVTHAVDAVKMNLTIRTADGQAIPFSGGQQTPPSDEDEDTFDVPCTLAYSGQPVTYATSQVVTGPDVTPPTPPGAPVASELSEMSVRLTWPGSTDASGITGYDVYRSGSKVATTTGTTAVIRGLGRGISYSFTVVARDGAGIVSLPGPATTVKTLPARPRVNLTFSCRFPLIGWEPVTISVDAWIPSLVYANVLTGAFPVRNVLVAKGDISGLLAMVGATSLEGRGIYDWKIDVPGRLLPIAVPFRLSRLDFPPDTTGDLTLVGLNTMPSLVFRNAGQGKITIEGLRLNLMARLPDGTPVEFAPVPGAVPSDEDPGTFDTPCTLNPDTQDKTLVSLTVL